MASLTRRLGGVCVLAGGALFIIIGVLVLTLIPIIIDTKVVEQDWLGYNPPASANATRELNDMTRKWINPPYDMALHIWMYHVDNEMEIVAGGKPRVRQLGPFTFIEKQDKSFHRFDLNDTRVFYRNRRRYFFNQSMSCAKCRLDDKVTIPNILFQKLNDFAESGVLAKFAVETVLTLMKRETPFITVTVGEALFDGYSDPLISAVCDKPVIKPLCNAAQIPDRIGFYYGKNGTDDGLYEVSTGQDSRWNIGKVYTWNNMTTVDDSFWSDPAARVINGTDGQMFGPLMKKGEPVTIFTGSLGRTIQFEYKRKSSYQGVAAWRFGFGKKFFDPAVPANRAFCNPDSPTYFKNTTVQIPGCLPAGFLDIGRTQPGQPRIYISQAHFLNAPKEVINSIDGILPEAHHGDETILDIEPTSAVVIQAKQRMQVNVGMKGGGLNILSKMPSVIMPVLWINETVSFDADTRDQLLNELLAAKHITHIAGVTVTTIGALCWVAFVVFIAVERIVKRAQPDDEQPILENDVIVSDAEDDN